MNTVYLRLFSIVRDFGRASASGKRVTDKSAKVAYIETDRSVGMFTRRGIQVTSADSSTWGDSNRQGTGDYRSDIGIP